MPRITRCVALTLLAFASGCTLSRQEVPGNARSILENAETFEILALHPYPHLEEGTPVGPEDSFRGYRILGRTAVPDASDRRRLVDLVFEGIDRSKGMVAACFDPRHGIHATRGGAEVDLVICYECLSMHLYRDGSDDRVRFLTAKSVEPEVTSLFEAHGLEIHDTTP